MTNAIIEKNIQQIYYIPLITQKGKQLSMKRNISVTWIHGFLEAGKTTYINQLLTSNPPLPGPILILSLEEGETDYDQDFLSAHKVFVSSLSPEEDLTEDTLLSLEKQYDPASVIIEGNMMWQLPRLPLPENWSIREQITLLAAPTLGMYLDNMRSLMGPVLSRCDKIIINRCDDSFSLVIPQKSKLRPLVNDPFAVILEAPGKTATLCGIEDIPPYDLTADPIYIRPEDYVTWYYDCMDHPDRYDGVRVSVEGNIRHALLKKHVFTFGLVSMTCCEYDMQFLGYDAYYEGIEEIPPLSYVRIEAIVTYPESDEKPRMPELQVTGLDVMKPGIVSWEF